MQPTLLWSGGTGCKFTNEFFDNVFEGNKALNFAILVHHQADSLFVFLKILHLRE